MAAMRTGCEPETYWARVTGTACGGEEGGEERGCEGGVTSCDTQRDISKIEAQGFWQQKKKKLFARQGDFLYLWP